MSIDVCFIEADSSRESYQELAKDYSAIETPTWSLLLAESVRSKGFIAAIIDQKPLRWDDSKVVEEILYIHPALIVFVVYGQNPNSGTTNMIGVQRLGEKIRQSTDIPVAIVGTHVSALPVETLSRHEFIDIGLLGDGVYALHNLLSGGMSDLSKVKGICYRENGVPVITDPELAVPHHRMDIDLPGYAWDLIPPLDQYRAHVWHPKFDETKRSPFAAIYTSLGCIMRCDFCCINEVNRSSKDIHTVASQFNTMKFWSIEHTLDVIDELVNRGVSTLRLSDEMFFLNKRYYEPLLQGIIDRGYDLHMWSYSRVDTVKEKYLELFKRAGVDWLCLGIEASSREVRREVSKGTFQTVDIHQIVKECESHGIEVLSNFMVGLPSETFETMQETMDLAIELNTAYMNVYTVMPLPGTELFYRERESVIVDRDYAQYAFLSYDCLPMATEYLAASEILRFREKFWKTYFTNPKYLNMIERKFGTLQRKNVEGLASIELKRKLLSQ